MKIMHSTRIIYIFVNLSSKWIQTTEWAYVTLHLHRDFIGKIDFKLKIKYLLGYWEQHKKTNYALLSVTPDLESVPVYSAKHNIDISAQFIPVSMKEGWVMSFFNTSFYISNYDSITKTFTFWKKRRTKVFRQYCGHHN